MTEFFVLIKYSPFSITVELCYRQTARSHLLAFLGLWEPVLCAFVGARASARICAASSPVIFVSQRFQGPSQHSTGPSTLLNSPRFSQLASAACFWPLVVENFFKVPSVSFLSSNPSANSWQINAYHVFGSICGTLFNREFIFSAGEVCKVSFYL